MTTSDTPRGRAHVVDAVRGLACLWMIEWHTADAWLDGALRTTDGFALAERIGGIAAPWFFLLAGAAAGLTESNAPASSRAVASARRGAQVAVLGYALKLFALAVDRGGLTSSSRAPAIVLGAIGLALMHEALGPAKWLATWLPEARTRGVHLALGALGAGLWATMLVLFRGDAEALELVTRLDVLQGIGAALIVLGLVLVIPVRGAPRWALPASLAVVVALTTAALTHVDYRPGALAPLVDYLARFPPFPAPSGARFPFLPWLGYALVGAAIGRAVRGAPLEGEFGLPHGTPRPALRAALVIAVTLPLAWACFETNPIAHWILQHGDLPRNLLRLGFYTSLAIGCGALVSVSALVHPAPARLMALLGRHSLVVYAVHLEIAYGLPTAPLAHTLGWGAWAFGVVLLTLAMLVLARALERDAKRDAPASTTRARAQA